MSSPSALLRSSIHVSVPIQTMVVDSKNGTCGRDVPLKIQFMLVKSKDSTEGTEQSDAPTTYSVFLPLLEGQFRAVLQGNDKPSWRFALRVALKLLKPTKASTWFTCMLGQTHLKLLVRLSSGTYTISKFFSFCSSAST